MAFFILAHTSSPLSTTALSYAVIDARALYTDWYEDSHVIISNYYKCVEVEECNVLL